MSRATEAQGQVAPETDPGTTAPILRAVQTMHRRLRVRSGLAATLHALPAICAVSSLALVLRRVTIAPSSSLVLSTFTLLVVASFGYGWLRAPSPLRAALLLDQLLGREGQLAAAFDLHGLRGPFARLVVQREENLLAGRDMSGTRPPGLGTSWVLAGLCLLAFVGTMFIPPYAPPPSAPLAHAPTRLTPQPELVLPEADAALLREEAQRALELASSEEGKTAARDLIALIEELQTGALSQAEAQRRAATLWADLELAQRSRADFASKLEERGAALAKSRLGADLGKALQERRLKDAAAALRALSERLADRRRPPSKKELEELRQAVAEAQKKRAEAQEKEERPSSGSSDEGTRRQLSEKQERLLDKKKKGTATAEDLAELDRTERQLKRLDRRKKEQATTLSDLDRALAEAAKEIEELKQKAREQSEGQPKSTPTGENAEKGSFERAAEGLSRQSSRQLTDAEKKELLKQLRRLKERLRQADEKGELRKQLEEFEQRAQGRRPDDSGPSIPQPGGQAAPEGAQTGAPEDGGRQQQAASQSGKEPGTGHDPDLTGTPSEKLDAQAEKKQAAAQDSGEGQSASETIRTAAEEGFTATSYEKLFAEYETVLEEIMDEESIPAGHRRSVQRYFELIRPREKTQR